MTYISVKEASIKFNLSVRRIQKLCETNRIDGCKMVGGAWIIPDTAEKPQDDRLSDLPSNTNILSLSELCKSLSISVATGRNWIKLGKITPKFTQRQTPYFEKNYVESLKKDILSGTNTSLKSRRNKKFVSGNALYNSYVSENCHNLKYIPSILSQARDENISFTDENIQYILSDCAVKFFLKKHDKSIINPGNIFPDFLEGNYLFDEKPLVDNLIEDKNNALQFFLNHPSLFSSEYEYEPDEDILGLIYISCKNIGNRKATGAYYTPTKIVKNLIHNLQIKPQADILDPCCGTGNFLLQLPSNIKFANIYGNDIDPISVKIARINIALKFTNIPVSDIQEHITESDFLDDYEKKDFTYIIGNPPWGYNFDDSEKILLRKKYKSTTTTNIESYDVFIEQSLSLLHKNGKISFVLPEAILNVKSHADIRNIILTQANIKEIDYLGNAFEGVQCPCIIFTLEKTNKKMSTKGMKIHNGKTGFIINTERNISSEYFSFITDDSEYSIIQKIIQKKDCVFLSGNADFALGIVTGNNEKYISNTKSKENEIILKGSDIFKYHFNTANNFITFKPENFQQVAPSEFYRADEKLLYRFISNQLVFAYDNKQTLSLNSCNIVIPKFKNLNIKYVMAILNSRIAQFVFKKEFNSIKVLRSHIENIPIPNISKNLQNKIIKIVDELIAGSDADSVYSRYDHLDSIICSLFDLSKDEQTIIKNAVDSENKFLI